MLKQFISGYLHFTYKERIGIISILVLIILFLLLPFFFSYFIPQKKTDYRQFENEIAALNIKQQDKTDKFTNRNFDENNYQNYYQPSEKNYQIKYTKGELFYFDPNTLSADGWKRLGVREKTVNTIQNYLSKGGRFYKPEDIGKIWGLHAAEAARLIPYVKIEVKTNTAFTASKNPEPDKTYEKSKYTAAAIEINETDTSTLIALPGIGSKLANRIIAFRDKLGGFYKVEQVAETFALPDSVFQNIKDRLVISNVSVRKININSVTVDELKQHPYIRYNIANAIIQYRMQHGNFANVNDLKKIMLITDDIYNKAAPYLTIN